MINLESTRRDLIAMRVKHGADSPIGHRCSNIIGMLENWHGLTGEEGARMQKNIAEQIEDLAKLTP